MGAVDRKGFEVAKKNPWGHGLAGFLRFDELIKTAYEHAFIECVKRVQMANARWPQGSVSSGLQDRILSFIQS